jgi:uncharacterized Tic20 family protein
MKRKMENGNLGKKVKELRMRQGLSQEQLAEMSQLSLRTIQRIENDETEASGYSLKSLAAALKVTPDDLIDWTQQEDKAFLSVLNLSALGFVFFPLLGVIIPLTLWILKKDKIRYVNETGKHILNFQITWSLMLFTVYGFLFLPMIFLLTGNHSIGMGLAARPFEFLGILAVLYLYNIAMVILNTVRSQQEKKLVYMPAFRFLK